MTDEEKKAIENLKGTYWYVGEEGLEENIKVVLNIIEKQSKEIEELKRENLEIRDWKYVIDNPIDLDKLKELDLIKIKGKEYIAKSIYNELEKDKKALINNYSNVLGCFISVDKIKAKIEEIDRKIEFEQNEKVIIYLHKQKRVLQSLLEKE